MSFEVWRVLDRRLLIGFAVLQLSIAAAVMSGLRFSQLGSANTLALLALAANAAALLSARLRDVLIRVVLLTLTLAFLRTLGALWIPNSFTSLHLLLLWLTLLFVLLAALDLCLFPLGVGLLGALRNFLPTVTTDAYRRDKSLWYTNRLVFLPLLSILAPFGISLVVCASSRNRELIAALNISQVSAIAMGVLLPLAVLSEGVFALRGDTERGVNNSNLRFAGYSVRWTVFGTVAALIYSCGLLSEYRASEMYALWSVCYAILLLTVLNVGRLSAFLSLPHQAEPLQFLEESKPLAKSWRRVGVLFLLLYAFGIIYIAVLALTFGS